MANLNQIVVTAMLNGKQYVGELSKITSATKAASAQMATVGNTASQSFNKAGTAATTLNQRLATMAKEALGNIARFTSYFLAVGLLTKAFGGVLSELRSFDAAMRNVQAITKESDALIRQHAETIAKLVLSGRSAGQGMTTMAEAMYFFVQAGYESVTALELVEVAAVGAAAGLTDTETAAKVLVAILQSYKLPASEANEVMNQLFTIVDKGVLTFEDLARTMSLVTPSAAALGIPLNELGAAVELLTRQGTSASRAMTNINAVLTALIKPNEKLAAVIESLGFASGSAMINTLGFGGALAAIGQKAGGSADLLAGWFGNVRAIRAILPLTANAGEDFNKMLEEHNLRAGEGTAHLDALKEQQKSLNFQLSQFTENLKVLVGAALQPFVAILVDVLKYLNDLMKELVVVNATTGEMVFLWEAHAGVFAVVKDAILAVVLALSLSLVPALIEVVSGLHLMQKAMAFFKAFGVPIALIFLAEQLGLLSAAFESLKNGGVVLDTIRGALIGFATLQIATAISTIASSFMLFGSSLLAFRGATSVLIIVTTLLAQLRVSLMAFLTSGPGVVLIITAIVVALSQLSKVLSAGSNLDKLKESLSEFNEEMDHINASKLSDVSREAAHLDASTRLLDESIRTATEGISQFLDPNFLSWDDWKANAGSALGVITSGFGLLGDGASGAEKVTNQFMANIEAAMKGLDSEALSKLAKGLKEIAALPENAKYAEMFDKADSAIASQIIRMGELERKVLEVKVAQGETTEQIEESNDLLAEVTEKVKTWGQNLKPVADFMKEIMGILTPEAAAQDAIVKDLEHQILLQEEAVELEKASRDATLASLKARKDELQDRLKIKGLSEGQEESIRRQIEGIDEQIEATNNLIGPAEEYQNKLKGNLEQVQREIDLKEALREKIAAAEQAEILRRMAAEGVVVTQREQEFLLRSMSALWAGDVEKVNQIADEMGIARDRAQELTTLALDTTRNFELEKTAIENVSKALSVPPALVQDLINKFGGLNGVTSTSQQEMVDYAVKIGIPKDKAQELIEKLREVDNTNASPEIKTDSLDRARTKALELLNLFARIMGMQYTGGGGAPSGGGSVMGQQHGVRDFMRRAQHGLRNMAGSIVKVGESGSELVFLPEGASVASAPKTSQIMDMLANLSGRGGDTNINTQFNLKAPSVEEIVDEVHRQTDELEYRLMQTARRSGARLQSGLASSGGGGGNGVLRF